MEPTFEQELEDWAIEFNNFESFIISLLNYHELTHKYPDKDLKQELIIAGLWVSDMTDIID
jgi:hypothetical protein